MAPEHLGRGVGAGKTFVGGAHPTEKMLLHCDHIRTDEDDWALVEELHGLDLLEEEVSHGRWEHLQGGIYCELEMRVQGETGIGAVAAAAACDYV